MASSDLRFSGERTGPVGSRTVRSSSSNVSGWLNVVLSGILNRTASSAKARQLPCAADRSIIPLVYGEDRIGGMVLNVAPSGQYTYIQVLWALQGDSVNDVRYADAAVSAGTTVTNYDGSQSAVDSPFVAAMAANSITYTDTLAGYMYSVIKMPSVDFNGSLAFTARIKGRKVYDVRKDGSAGGTGAHRLADPSTWEWSDCPTLHYADFLYSNAYGCNETVDWSTATAPANANDALVSGSEKRRISGVSFIKAANTVDMAETLRAYASVFAMQGASGIKLLADEARNTDTTYSHASGDIAELVSIEKKDTGSLPTVVEVIYTDTTAIPWRDATAYVEASGVGSTVPRRVSQVAMPGVHRYTQAYREAVERLNKIRTNDLAVVVDVWDKGIAHEPGDVIEVTHPVGLTSKKLRIGDIQAMPNGIWRLYGSEYDPAAYSNSLASGPSYPDTLLPNSRWRPTRMNMLPNADWTDDIGYGIGEYVDSRALRKWRGYGYGAVSTKYFGRNYAYGAAWNIGKGGCYLRIAGTNVANSNGMYIVAEPQVIITAGRYYELQGVAQAHRSKVWMYLRFYNQAGTAFYDAGGSYDSFDSGNGTNGTQDTLDGRYLLWKFGKAPVTADGASGWSDATAQNAYYCQPIFGVEGNGNTDPYGFFHRAALFTHDGPGLTKDRATDWVDSNNPTFSGLQADAESITKLVDSKPADGNYSFTVGGQYSGGSVDVTSVSWTNDTANTVGVQVGYSGEFYDDFAGTQGNYVLLPVSINGSNQSGVPSIAYPTGSFYALFSGVYVCDVPAGQQIIAKIKQTAERLVGGYSGATHWMYWRNVSLNIQAIKR